VGRFVPMVMVVDREDARGAWTFSNISILKLIPLYCTVHQLVESDS
jgi:hypothetical protein